MVKKSFSLEEMKQAFPEQADLIRDCGDYQIGFNFDPHRDHSWMPVQLRYFCQQLANQDGSPCLVSEFYGIEFPAIMKSLADPPYYEAEDQDAEWRKARIFLGRKVSDQIFLIPSCYSASTHVLLYLPSNVDESYWSIDFGAQIGGTMWDNGDGSTCIIRELPDPKQNLDIMAELAHADEIKDYLENEA